MAHWYDLEGAPRHFEGKGGKPTTLREARKAAADGDVWVPSVTTILGITNKPALTNWIAEEAAMTALECMEGVTLFDRSWAREVIKLSRERTMAKADEGTDIHDILEAYVKGNPVADEHLPMCEAVKALLDENCGDQDWSPELSFSDERGFGGKCDLHSAEWVVDYKTKDEVDDKTRGFPEQAEQLAAYAHGLCVPDARVANIFISRSNPTDVKFFEHNDDMAWLRFIHTAQLWQVKNKYGPYYESLTTERKAA